MRSSAAAKILYAAYFSLAKHFLYPGRVIRTTRVMRGVTLGKGVIIKAGVAVAANVSIGDYTFINEQTRIDPNTRVIGKYCSISQGVKIGMGPHPLDFFTTSPLFYEPQRGLVPKLLYDEYARGGYTEIGNDVLVGANAIVMAGVKIGDGAVIAAGSVVTRDVEPFAIMAGVPARLVRHRFAAETIEKLLALRWWDMPAKTIARHAAQGFDIDAFIAALTADRDDAH